MELQFDFLKRGRSIKDVGPQEQDAALYVLMGYLTKELAGKTQEGAYSEEALGCPAVEYFASIAMAKVFNGNWTWREGVKLTTLLCNCAYSEKGHWARDWKKKKEKGTLEPPPVSYIADPEKLLDKLEADEANQMKEEERAEADELEEQRRKIGFDEAKKLVADNPKLLKLVKAIEELDSMRAIEKRMKMRKAECEEAFDELLNILRNANLQLKLPHQAPPKAVAR